MKENSRNPEVARSWRQTAMLVSGLALVITMGISPYYKRQALAAPASSPNVSLLGLGDSLTHGTMDASNNALNTRNAYLQKVADSLGQVVTLSFSQPYFNFDQKRVQPFKVPTNLGVDGADVFSLEGIEYYKRVGEPESYLTSSYLCDKLRPKNLADKYDKVLYPLNLLAGKSVSQVDGAVVAIDREGGKADDQLVLLLLWIGNNDTSLAALGTGGAKPSFLPFPFTQIAAELTPVLRNLLTQGASQGEISFAPYTQEALDRNMTDLADFTSQYQRVLNRLLTESSVPADRLEVLVLTLPYYSAIGYLFDSEDLEFYLQKANPAYQVPATFKRVAPAGEPISDPLQGDRISLFTFGFMYALLESGYSVDYVNEALEKDGVQEDGLVLSEAEQQYIMARIDSFNAAIIALAQGLPMVNILDIGGYLNMILGGQVPVTIGDKAFSRKWSRGGAFGLDGVHPGYTGQALVANYLLTQVNALHDWNAPLHDLETVLAIDPYQDKDNDGWVPGPTYNPAGLTEILFMLTDPNDQDPEKEMELPPNFWRKISNILLKELLGIPALAELARSEGIWLSP